MHPTHEKGTEMKHTAKPGSTPKRGAFAALRAFHRSAVGGVPSTRLFAALFVFAALAALLPVLAAADTRIGAPQTSVFESYGPAGHISEPGGVAVSAAEGGDLYVADSGNSRIDQFHPDGTFVRAFGWKVNAENPEEKLQICTAATGCRPGTGGPGPGQLDHSDEIAADNDPASLSYGDVYVVDQKSYRVEKFDPEGHFLLMFGGGVDHTTGADLCTAADIAGGDTCGAGVPGTGPSHFYSSFEDSWNLAGNNSIAVGPDGTVYVGDFRRVQKFEPDGTFIGELTVPAARSLGSLAIDAESHVYVNSLAADEHQFVSPPSSGTFELCFKSACTAPLAFNASQEAIASALRGLSTIGSGNIRFEFNGVRLGIVFEGVLADANVPQVTTSAGSVDTSREGGASQLVELGPSGEVLQAFDTEPGARPEHIALDSAGDLFLSEPSGKIVLPGDNVPRGEEIHFRAYRPSGALYADFTSDQVRPIEDGQPAFAAGIAVGDVAGKLYVMSQDHGGTFNASLGFAIEYYAAVAPLPAPSAPLVTEQHLTDLEPTTATLHAVVNPAEFDTTYHFEYTTTDFANCGQPANPNCLTTPEHDLGSIFHQYPVQAAISGLTTSTAYKWRVVATSSAGTTAPEEEFKALPPVTVQEFTTQTVGPELVQLKARLNANNGTGTEYAIHYGTDQSYASGSVHGTLSLGSESVKKEATFTGLQPNTTYHYQLTAHNSYGEVKTDDATFTTEETLAEQNAASPCPNAILREENGSLALPDCRAYEQVSPTFKNGFPVGGNDGLSPGGEAVLYGSTGAFGDADTNAGATTQYIARRTAAGWFSHAPAGRPAGFGYQPTPVFDATAEYDRWLFLEVPGFNAESIGGNGTSGAFYMGHADGAFDQASPTLSLLEGEPRNFETAAGSVVGQSDNLSQIFIETATRFLPAPEDPRPDGNGTKDRIYRLSGADGPNPTISLLAETPPAIGEQEGCRLNEGGESSSIRHSPADGSAFFYVAPIKEVEGAPCGNGKPNPIGLFARTGESPPVQLNLPFHCTSPHPCATAANARPHFDGVSPDGSRAWFTTTQPLLDSDTDTTTDLYLAKLDQDGQLTELIQATRGESGPGTADGDGAGLLGNRVLRLSQDASHASLVATGVLTEEANARGQEAAQGADNLYVYDATSGQTKFLARLCSASERSGSLPEPACPASLPASAASAAFASDRELWEGSDNPRLHLTPDGRYLLFATYARLTPDDTDEVQDVYRYDLFTGQLTRVSIGRRGNDAGGNDDLFPATIPKGAGGQYQTVQSASELTENEERPISADGSTVVFTTKAPLVSRDTNSHHIAFGGPEPGGGNCTIEIGCYSGNDVYQWEESGHGTCHEAGGCVSLVSDGLDPHGAEGAVISPSGRDVTFITSRPLVPADTDDLRDVYDARVEGGFPPPVEEPCHPSAAHCPGPESLQPNPPTIGTETFVGSGNSKEHEGCAKGRVRVKKHGQIRCVAKKSHKAKKHHKRAAGHRRGGGK
jgi:hypothetical protein